MKPQRILVIGINYSPEPTGIGRYTGDMGAWLSEQGHHVEVVTARPYYPQWKVMGRGRKWFFEKESISGVDVLRCPLYVPSDPTALRRILQDLSFFLSSMAAVTWFLLIGKRFDTVVSVTPSLLSALSGRWYRFWRRDARSVVRVMDLQADAAGELGMIKSSWLMRIVLGVESLVLKKADWVCPITPAMQRMVVRKGVDRSKTFVFPLWVDFDRVWPREPDPDLMESLGLPADRKVVMYSGAVGEKQGLEVIVEMALAVREEMPELLFVVCGSGPYTEALKALSERKGTDNLKFLEIQPEDVFIQLLNRAWLHLVVQRMTKTESYLPSKLMNIMAVGGLSLVTAFPGTTLHSIVHDNQAGMLVSEPDAEPMVRTLRLLMENPAEVGRLKGNALRYARRNLGRDPILREWAEGIGLG